MDLWVFYAGFTLFVLAMLALDLGVFHRHAHEVSLKEAGIWSVVWVTIALIFNVLIYFMYEQHWLGIGTGPLQEPNGLEAAKTFFLGYVIEKSLSVDNVFVFALIFTYFAVPAKYQHRVLFYGVLGALVMRAIFIALGAALIAKFGWIIYIFGAFLLFTGIKMALMKHDEEIHPERNPVLKLLRRIMPVTNHYHGQTFLIRRDELDSGITDLPVKDQSGVVNEAAAVAVKAGKWVATPLLVVLIMVETTDLIFAVDSIPAIFGITQDPFIVYTSNVFAILGLRALYFLLAGIMHKFHYLKLGLAVVLSFIGVKMCVNHYGKDVLEIKEIIPTGLSLIIVLGVLAAAVIASWRRASRLAAAQPGAPGGPAPSA